jgi:bifunctional DNase/RNase
MKKRELKILGLSYSQTQIGCYVLVLSDKRGKKKLPLIIKTPEAQKIALELESLSSGSKPMIYDVVKNICDSFAIDVQEVFLYQLAEGIFYSKIILFNGIEEVEIECGSGDAIAIATIFKCPIYTTNEILDIAGVVINDDGTQPEDIEEDDNIEEDDDFDDMLGLIADESSSKRIVSVEDLDKMMQEAIINEEYEIAAELRDRIQKLKEN